MNIDWVGLVRHRWETKFYIWNKEFDFRQSAILLVFAQRQVTFCRKIIGDSQNGYDVNLFKRLEVNSPIFLRRSRPKIDCSRPMWEHEYANPTFAIRHLLDISDRPYDLPR